MEFSTASPFYSHGMSPSIGQDLDYMQNSRRSFLKLGCAALAPALFSPLALSQDAPGFWSQPRTLWMQRRTSRGMEEFNGVYFADGKLLLEPYIKICRLMRDVQANEAVQISPVLLDILCGIQGIARVEGHSDALITTSGHRSKRTNAQTEGAVKGSLHIEGRAWDGRMAGQSAPTIAASAKYLQGGGVGLYVDRNFCHVDDGRLRSWRGT